MDRQRQQARPPRPRALALSALALSALLLSALALSFFALSDLAPVPLLAAVSFPVVSSPPRAVLALGVVAPVEATAPP